MKRKRARSGRKASEAAPRTLLYKVVEVSTVDEGALERTLNEWVPRGWTFDGVQFAMRESSKRPAMAFVFFTRQGAAGDEAAHHGGEDATLRLMRLAEAQPAGPTQPPPSAYERLLQLAQDGEDES